MVLTYMKKAITFEDVLLIPQFTDIKSRADVNLSVKMFNKEFKFPIMSAPMSSITGSEMCNAMTELGGIGILHRFMSIEDNVKEFIKANRNAICSLGLFDFKRYDELYKQGCRIFNIDVANGATQDCVKFYNELRLPYGDTYFIIGNFATAESIIEFNKRSLHPPPDAYRINIGGGSVCKTRLVSGCGVPALQTLLDCKEYGIDNVICDGGLENSGDIVKALAAGAKMVITGYLLAGTDESASEWYDSRYNKTINPRNNNIIIPISSSIITISTEQLIRIVLILHLINQSI